MGGSMKKMEREVDQRDENNKGTKE